MSNDQKQSPDGRNPSMPATGGGAGAQPPVGASAAEISSCIEALRSIVEDIAKLINSHIDNLDAHIMSCNTNLANISTAIDKAISALSDLQKTCSTLEHTLCPARQKTIQNPVPGLSNAHPGILGHAPR
jgi:hypothetical protein